MKFISIFKQNVKLDLGLGWYCENVAGSRGEHIVPNALKKDNWKENPSVPFNMISYMGIPIFWPDGEVFGTFCMLDNKEKQYPEIFMELLKSLREIIQNDLQSILLYEQAKTDLIKKDFQLREIHHQVKNHFNLLISTISLQSFKNQPNDRINSVLSDIQSRIAALAVIHDKISYSMNLENVLLGEYLTELGKHILNNLSKFEIKFNCTAPQISVTADISVPCGLILNELITNSIKYAFENISSPEINVILEKCDDEKVILNYFDNGRGLPPGFDFKNLNSLGMKMIKHSVLRLDGSFQIYNGKGFHLATIFKIPDNNL